MYKIYNSILPKYISQACHNFIITHSVYLNYYNDNKLKKLLK